MRMPWIVASTMLVSMCSVALAVAEEDHGESKAHMVMKMRVAAPKPADMAEGASLEALLAKTAEADWSGKKAASITGYIVQCEREEDGDVHVVLAAAS